MKENYFLTFLKGLLMGIADIIPGVSGGTIAFITGIYDRLINGIKDIGNFLGGLFNKKKKKKIDFPFFIPLIIGIGIAFIIGSQFISFLLESYPAQIYSFFIGLILASAYIIFRKIKTHKINEILFGILGLAIGLSVSLIPHSQGLEPSIIFIFFMGMISICAMILPGISGAYIVLIFGQLEFMYDAIGNFLEKWPYLIAFAIGAIIGLLSFSRLLSYLLKKHHSKTLYALTGIMLGALLRPIRIVLESIQSEIIVSALLLIAGIILVIIIEKMAGN